MTPIARFRTHVRRLDALGHWTLVRRQLGREGLIRILRDGAAQAAFPAEGRYAVARVWHPVLGVRQDERMPEERVTPEEVRRWQAKEWGRTGLKPKVAACLTWLSREFGHDR